jgi:hypothetical protein
MSTDPNAPHDPAAGVPGSAPGDPSATASGPTGAAGAQPSEADRSEIGQRAAYEAELARITSTDMMLQAAVSLLNIGSYRLMPASASGAEAGAPAGAGRDLEQARDAIDGVRALLEILERRVPSELRPLRDALSQLQMAYAREVQATGGEPGQGGDQAPSGGDSGAPSGGTPGASGGGSAGQGPAPDDQGRPGPGPAESSGRLWVPGR